DQARSATLPLPAVILEKVREGEALGPVMSRYTGIDEIGRKEGDQARSATLPLPAVILEKVREGEALG
ncbi:DUF84 family protein, partial [Klebsiella pneumoniae]|uniref:DUF84 family protein n=1 Tax=Klebsiella pneumoniae TaxID=573 RepID=UPI00211B664F